METYQPNQTVHDAPQPSEDEFTKAIEKYTASIPHAKTQTIKKSSLKILQGFINKLSSKNFKMIYHYHFSLNYHYH